MSLTNCVGYDKLLLHGRYEDRQTESPCFVFLLRARTCQLKKKQNMKMKKIINILIYFQLKKKQNMKMKTIINILIYFQLKKKQNMKMKKNINILIYFQLKKKQNMKMKKLLIF